jgi:release factor glutamine methyltransferase
MLGKWDFLNYTFQIHPPLICLHPETEELVLKVVEDAKRLSGTVQILDIGCGTGAIGVSLMVLLRDTQVMAIDVKPIAVSTSNKNASSF